jgi:hypothetical protein
LLTILADSLPGELRELSVDFNGCTSINGGGFLELFEKVSLMEGIEKLHLDLS